MPRASFSGLVEAVYREIESGKAKHGEFTNAIEGFDVLDKQVSDLKMANAIGSKKGTRKEAIQVAAVAMRIVMECDEANPA